MAKINFYMIGDAAIFRLVSFFCDFIFIVTFLHICFFFFLLFLYARSVTECVGLCVCKNEKGSVNYYACMYQFSAVNVNLYMEIISNLAGFICFMDFFVCVYEYGLSVISFLRSMMGFSLIVFISHTRFSLTKFTLIIA